MRARSFFAAWLTCTAAAAVAAPPARYLPAPAGKFYYLLAGNVAALGSYTSSETTPPAPWDGKAHKFESEFNATAAEIGVTGGYGLGKVWFLKAVDVSLYAPFTSRSFKLDHYFVEDPAPAKEHELAYAGAFLHSSLRDGADGKGLGDLTLSTMALLYANPASGMWLSSAVRLTLPTGSSAAGQFARILHGEAADLGSGGGTTRVTPVVSFIKMIAGQRLYLSGEYALPLTKEKVTFRSPDLDYAPGLPYGDADLNFEESFTPGAIAGGTVGLETTLAFWGIVPGVEATFHQYAPAKWVETVGGVAVEPGSSTMNWPNDHPTTTGGFLQNAMWSTAGLALKSNMEVEVGLLFSKRFGAGDQLKAGLSYLTSAFGTSLGVKVQFVSLFLERAQSEHGVPGHAEAREVEVSPVLEAPLAPATLIPTGVTFPQAGAGVSQEEASWTAAQLRAGVKKLRGYDLFPEKAMEQLATSPCGDAECGTRYGRALKLPAMVVARLEKAGAGFALGVQMINVADGTAAASDSVSAGSLEDLKTQIPALLQRLVAPATPSPQPPPPAAPAGK